MIDKLRLIVVSAMFLAIPSLAQTAAVSGHCIQGGTTANVSGLKSTNYLQGIIPSCTVTVYLTGTTTIATTTPQSPFTANTASSIDPGGWTFTASTSQALDVVGSGGIAPNVYAQPTPLAIDVTPGGGGGGGAANPAGPAFAVNFANSAVDAFQGDPGFTINPTTHTVTIPNIALGTGGAANIGVVGVGESTICGNTLQSTQCTLGIGTAGGVFPFNAGTASEDLVTQICNGSQFAGRYAFCVNKAQGGTTCEQMTANYISQNLAQYAPGGSAGLPSTGIAYMFIWTGKNNADSGENEPAFSNCQENYLQTVTAGGFTPIELTVYYSNTQSDNADILMNGTLTSPGYNQWYRQVNGRIINGKKVQVLDVSQAFAATGSNEFFQTAVNQTFTTFLISSYQITQTGTAPNLSSTITMNLNPAGTGNNTLLGTCSQDLTHPQNPCGFFLLDSFQDTPSQQLNGMLAQYVSGTGTNTIVAKLANPLPSTGLITPTFNGSFWAYWQLQNAGLHMGPAGYKAVAKYINNALQISNTGDSLLNGPSQDYFRTQSGLETHANAVCIEGDFVDLPGTGNRCQGTIVPGQIFFETIPETGATSGTFFSGASATLFQGPSSFLAWRPNGFTWDLPTFTGPANSIGSITPTGNPPNSGSGWKNKDTFTIGAGPAIGTVTGVIDSTGKCNTLTSTPGAMCQAQVTTGGAPYPGNMAGVAVTAISPSVGTGATVSTFAAVSVPATFNFPGLKVSGGSVYAADSITGSSTTFPLNADQKGWLGSFTVGSPTTATTSSAGFGSGITSGTVATIVQTGSGNNATVTVTSNTTGVATATLNPPGGTGGYVNATGVPVSGCSGSETGLTFTIIANTSGVITSQVPDNPGNGAAIGDTCHITQGSANTAIITVATVASQQAVSFANAATGTGYSSANAVPTSISGLFVNIRVHAGAVVFGDLGNGIFDTGNGVNWRASGPVNLTEPGFSSSHVCTTANGACGAGSNPLTTKGDLFGFSTVAARIPVGTNGQVLTADSTNALGVSWQPGGGGGSGISGLTAGQVGIAGSATTLTSSIPINGAGTGLVTGPASTVSGDVVTFSGAAGAVADSGTLLSSLAPKASPTFTGAVTTPAITISGITGSTECLQANTSGVVSGTGSPCGSGGGSGTVTTSGTPTTGVFSLFTGSTVIGNSHLDDGVTTASTITSTEPIVVTGTNHGLSFPASSSPLAPASGFGIYSVDASGNPEASVNGGAYSLFCTVANALCSSGGSITLQTAGVNNSSQTLLNFVNPSVFNGLTFAWSNPTGGNETFGITGTLANAGLANSSVTIGSTNVVLGATASTIAGLTLTSPTATGTLTSAAIASSGNFVTTGTANLIETRNTTAATSSTCAVPGAIVEGGTYWTGSASSTNTISLTNTCATGANGAETLTVADAGSTGLFTLAVSGAVAPQAYNQSTASSSGGTCSMASAISCTITLGHTYTTPVCIATQQSATLTGGAVGCTVSGTTVTITAATSNSETWGAFVFGNPN